uniref:Uncharacterized protein n=1 Tax=Globodera rostochiensis TaxID=31243 RepID=A0A914HYN0_GLORO
MWIRTMNEQNCAGQICSTGTFCMRPALFSEPQHCVHADSVLNVSEALASGNTLVRCEEIVPLLTLVAQFLIFLVLLAHLCVFLCHRRRSAHFAMSGGAKSKLSCGNEGAEWGANADNSSAQTDCNSNAKYVQHQQQRAQHGDRSFGQQMLLDQPLELNHPLIMMQNTATYHQPY